MITTLLLAGTKTQKVIDKNEHSICIFLLFLLADIIYPGIENNCPLTLLRDVQLDFHVLKLSLGICQGIYANVTRYLSYW